MALIKHSLISAEWLIAKQKKFFVKFYALETN